MWVNASAILFEEKLILLTGNNQKSKQRKSHEGSHLKGNAGGVPGGQWLGLHASTVGNMGLIPDQGAKILHAAATAKTFFFFFLKQIRMTQKQ